ncbi:MAG: type II toxin-antitoxin system prevent-host-death family antitoxin [Hyphomicrobiales bacterium]|nr:type II toxin-antitoxin system prevent-host-death family antitoxin [Hyphomicrobiales bacterium]MBV8661909.1 type II toxin-antitoxin system prevent-host-death family antitoxin [Hyphomicrobiales bacterium]
MIIFSSLDLQQRTGDIQRAATTEPVLITSHGKPRSIVLSAEEFRRLKEKAGEDVPAEVLQTSSRTLRAPNDPLGYNMSDYETAVDRMIEDVRSGRTAAAVEAELGNVRRLFAKVAR